MRDISQQLRQHERAVHKRVRRAVRDHDDADELSRFLYEEAEFIEAIVCDNPRPSPRQNRRIDRISTAIRKGWEVYEDALLAPHVQEAARKAAMDLLPGSESIAGRTEMVIFTYDRHYIAHPAIVALTDPRLAAGFESHTIGGRRVSCAPRWVYDLICQELEVIERHTRRSFCSPAVTPPSDGERELFLRLVETMDYEDAATASRVLVSEG